MKSKTLILYFYLIGMSISAFSQSVLITTQSSGIAKPSALLDLDVSGSTSKKGLLIPRMTNSEMNSIASPANSLLVYATDATTGYYYFDSSAWRRLGADDLGNHIATSNINTQGNWLSGDGSNAGVLISAGNDIGIGVANPNAKLHVNGTVRMDELAGSGTRMVVADSEGDLSTQAIPSGGPGSGSMLLLHLTSNETDVDVSGVSYIHASTTGGNEIKGLVGGVMNQIIYLINSDNVDDIKFQKNEGTQEFLKDFDLQKQEGGIIMFDGVNWLVISKH